ncbi:MAG: AraC family transcriptional regulator [Planctomycetota bacterium]|nr:AraC family transcriptional regulator [Planctomycetota bacterium]
MHRPWKELWGVGFRVPGAAGGLVRPLHVGRETTSSPAYRSEGRLRRKERHCIFYYVLGGCVRTWRGRRSWTVPAGSGFLHIVNEPDGGYGYPRAAREPLEFLWFGFAGGGAREIVAGMIARHGPVYRLPPAHPAIRRLAGFQARAGSAVRLRPLEGARLVMDLLADLEAAAGSDSPGSRSEALAERAMKLIEGRCDGISSVKQLSGLLHVSREHLSRTFREVYDASPAVHLRRARMVAAARLLKETDLPVKEVARRLGCDRPANFARVFRDVIGSGPLEFRRRGVVPLF